MLGIYFSGTGNTKHCVSSFTKQIDENSKIIPLESSELKSYIINEKDTIVFGYPVQFSNAPIFVRDSIIKNKDVFKGKNIFIIATMGLFSGDGAACSARIFKKVGANVIGGLHLRMPDSVCDVSTLKKAKDENKNLINEADEKIKRSVELYLSGHPTKDGLSFFSHVAGLFGQRLWFYSKTAKYSDKLKINTDECIKCGKCISECPTGNLNFSDDKVVTKNKCTMCYRCISQCPKKAITLIGKEVVQQYRYDNIK